jgi:hypothetical protein
MMSWFRPGLLALAAVPALLVLGAGVAVAMAAHPTAAVAAQPTPFPSDATPTPTPLPVTLTAAVGVNNPFFTEDDARVTTTAPLAALTVVITVQRTAGLRFSGEYDTVGSQVQESSSSTASTITYTFTLTRGSLAPGSYVFAAQAGGSGTAHPTSGDMATVTIPIGFTNAEEIAHF